MGDYISELPDDILCHIFSSLTVRDAFRVKSLSPSWKDLLDTRTLLQFDASTMTGGKYVHKFEFVKAVDQFLKIWRAEKASSLKIKYDLGSVSNSVIDGWVLTAIGKEIEELDLDFSSGIYASYGTYILSCHLLDTGYLKHLRLTSCRLNMICDASTRWLSKLRTLELKYVPVCLRDVECILSTSPNLESLRFEWDFKTFEPVIIQHPSLKKLTIVFVRECHVELICPKLETFELSGFYCDFTYSKVPLLKEAFFNFCKRYGGCAEDFTSLATNVPCLQTLSLWLTSEIKPLPPSITMSCLKRLGLHVKRFRRAFDIFTIMQYLYACPVLEELILTVESSNLLRHAEERRHVDCPHFHLKEVRMEGVMGKEISTLVEYLLRNGVSLQQMVFIVKPDCVPFVTSAREECSMWQTINPSVKVVLELKGV